MIRVVLAVLLTATLLAIAVPAIDRGGVTNTEGVLDREAAEIETAATSLVDDEDPPPVGVDGARRSLTLTLPGESFTTAPVDRFEIHRVGDDHSVVRYTVDGGHVHTMHVDAPIVDAADPGSDTIELRGTGERSLVLTLTRDRTGGKPVVELSRR
ncbi:DUF7311 family protein [Natranaeroarchaeum sulfidigenes]|uniref:Putative pilin/flagellin n=1 Tax=Natranaeroarchaeum sulfidigenes TaxID=2784880 RepID=A0A897MSG4_9EURY|nr:hypothetical protein [Natranaeroarchaeum sulfidigenes]QSG03447.1 putative pilin/flagellin [Natranaeroarchaeum sulfidigenes]